MVATATTWLILMTGREVVEFGRLMVVLVEPADWLPYSPYAMNGHWSRRRHREHRLTYILPSTTAGGFGIGGDGKAFGVRTVSSGCPVAWSAAAHRENSW